MHILSDTSWVKPGVTADFVDPVSGDRHPVEIVTEPMPSSLGDESMVGFKSGETGAKGLAWIKDIKQK